MKGKIIPIFIMTLLIASTFAGSFGIISNTMLTNIKDIDRSTNSVTNTNDLSTMSFGDWPAGVELVSEFSSGSSYISNDLSDYSSIAVDKDGGVHVVWEENTDTGCAGDDKDIYYRYRNPNGVWSYYSIVSEASPCQSSASSNNPSIAVDNNGGVHIVWSDESDDLCGSGSDQDIFYQYRHPAGGYGLGIQLVSIQSNSNSILPKIAVDDDGGKYVTWVEYGGDMDVVLRYCDCAPGEIWDTSTKSIISSGSDAKSSRPSIALGGGVHVVWEECDSDYGGGDTDIVYSTSIDNGATWNDAEVISTESNGNSYSPSIGFSCNNLHVAWQDYSNYAGCGSDPDIFYKQKQLGDPWPASTSIVSHSSNSLSFRPALASEDHITFVAWADDTDTGSGSDRDIFYSKNSYANPNVWVSPEIVSVDSNTESSHPALAVGDGKVHVSWTDATETGYYEDSDAAQDKDIYYNANVPFDADVMMKKRVKDTSTGDWVTETSACINEIVTFKLLIYNDGECELDNFLIEDTLPPGLEYVTGSTTQPGEPQISASGNLLTWSFGLVPGIQPGHDYPIEFQAKVTSLGQKKNCVNIEANWGIVPGLTETTSEDCAKVRGIDCSGCVDVNTDLTCPPIAWWPLDEDDMGADIIGNHDGTPGPGTCGPPISVPGKVDEACRFKRYQIGNPNHPGVIRVYNDPLVEIGEGDFTIDAWVYPEDISGATTSPCDYIVGHCQNRTIVSNRCQKTQGITFFVKNENWDSNTESWGSMRLALEMTSESLGPYDEAPVFLSDPNVVELEKWQHVAVTISREGQTPIGTFYKNGDEIGTFTPELGILYEDTYVQLEPALDIGHGGGTDGCNCIDTDDGYCSCTNSYFNGRLDEVEIFDCCLSQDSIKRLYIADSEGKCKPGKGDLQCSGTLRWSKIDPGETVTSDLTIENIGGPDSKLNWEIESYPEWGTWSFKPSSGENLGTEKVQNVKVTVTAPDEKDKFTGEVKIVNTDDSSDSCTISVSLSTPKNKVKTFNLPIFHLLNNYPMIYRLLTDILKI